MAICQYDSYKCTTNSTGAHITCTWWLKTRSPQFLCEQAAWTNQCGFKMMLLLLGRARHRVFPPKVLLKRVIGGQPPRKDTNSPYFSMSAVHTLALCRLNRFVHDQHHLKAEIVLQCNTWPDFPVSVVISRNFASKSTQIRAYQ